MNPPLQDKVALITGSAKNMGQAFALSLAQQGCDIVIHYHSESARTNAQDTAEKIIALGRRASVVQADLSCTAQVKNLFAQALEAFGKIDIVINNAGQVCKKAFIDYSESDFDALFNVNAKGAFFVMQEAAKTLQDNGRVINIGTSLLGAFTGNYALYAGSKAPVEHFTKALAKEVGARGITVNMICPGPVDTDFFHGQEDTDSVAYLSTASVAGRLGTIKDIVPMVDFLCSSQSQWTTGQILFVNGGFVSR
ncbi:short-chain dehydrogenase [Pseudoalteromonas luteoviolacea]|uniref:Short-chain dehydrogenase n=1 Tax=Pseudoalteromonas luteoviolacea TaxID=43657 RepID=A0A0C1MNA1_9GAMM|nr:SDR family oxidoreductase [Pseudoalteromonas luteoviolacea]KID55983.1 short-chain dehydrogenase [Pseudoalteromonas luteoviolacea]